MIRKRFSIILIFFVGIAVGWQAKGETISEHNEQHVAEMTAQNLLFDAGCTRTNITRIQRFSVESVDDYYVVNGNGLRVECVKSVKYSITWDAPTHRSDGTVLTSSEISHYELVRDGNVIARAQCCEIIVDSIESLSIRTVDTFGKSSAMVPVQ